MAIISITAQYIDVSGIRTFYETNGCQQPQTLVCLHAEGRETRQFHRLMDALEPYYRVIAFDMPAHGKTWAVNGKAPMEEWGQYVDFAWSFLKAMHLEDALLLGCGLGASLALAIAQEHPVKGVVSISGKDYNQVEINYDLINHPHISTPHMMLEYNSSITGRDADREARELIRWQTWSETAITIKADLRMLCNMDLRDGMKHISCPVLVLWGEDDWTIDMEEETAVMQRLGDIRKQLLMLERTGRYAMLEQPQKTADAITAFFGKV